MKNGSQEIFLKILSDFCNNRPTRDLPEHVDWKEIVYTASVQNLWGAVYVQCRDFLLEKQEYAGIYKYLQQGFGTEVFYSICQQQDFAELERRFTEESIPFLPVKGQVLRNMWPSPELREMGDMDILIHKCDRERVQCLMKKMGYCREHSGIDDVWSYRRDVTEFEIHTDILYEELTNKIDYIAYFHEAWLYAKRIEGSTRYELDKNYHFVYVLTHAAKHFANHGFGFRFFMDMMFFVQAYGREMDWEWIKGELKKLELLRFTETCFALCRRWFLFESPIYCKELEEEFYRDATQMVYCDGVFGQARKENAASVMSKALHREKEKSYAGFALTWAIKVMFPGYEQMRMIPWYSFLEGRPWLLPAAWIYRFGYCLKNKAGQSFRRIFIPLLERKQIRKKEEKIGAWGL